MATTGRLGSESDSFRIDAVGIGVLVRAVCLLTPGQVSGLSLAGYG